jgi:hypothetical protein
LVSYGRKPNQKEANVDEFYKRKGLWIGLGALAIIFLCVMLCMMGAFFTVSTRSSMIYEAVPQVQAPTGGESVAPPAVQYYGPLGVPRHGGFSPFSILFRMLFFGLLVLLFIGLIKRIFWRHRHWAPYYRRHHPHWPPAGTAPRGKPGKHPPHPTWGPWAWHAYCGWGEPEDQPASQEEEAGTAETGTEDVEYNGPQE